MTIQILVVDDNPTNLKLASDLMLEIGGLFDHQGCGRRKRRKKMLEQTTPDLILMDIALPGMDGLTLTRKLKADERLETRPRDRPHRFRDEGRRAEGVDAGCNWLHHQADRHAQIGATVADVVRAAQPHRKDIP
jgi:CheY-like chemotaxis protein